MSAVSVLLSSSPGTGTTRAVVRAWAPWSSHVIDLPAEGGRGQAIREGLRKVQTPYVVIHDTAVPASSEDLSRLLQPLHQKTADVVFARRSCKQRWLSAEHWLEQGMGMLHSWPVSDPFSPLRAFRTDALQKLALRSDGEDIDVEIVTKLVAQRYRFEEIALETHGATRPTDNWTRCRAVLRYALTHNDADNVHEGYNTLARMEGAAHYNHWIASQLRPHLGRRVLEVGAGIGTLTQALEADRDLYIALEVDPFYVDRLRNIFRDKPHVRPWLSDVSDPSWEALSKERLDSIVLSNVLEHIENDARAVHHFRQVLSPGGRLVLWVPALPRLYGAIDEAVGHHRRYTAEGLRALLEGQGFAVETLKFQNLVGIPGWYLNSRVLRRRAVPPLQLRIYDAVVSQLARWESRWSLPTGLSLLAVARAS